MSPWSSQAVNDDSGAGFNVYTLDGPGQGEMWKDMRFMSDYESVVSAIIDWFIANDNHCIDLTNMR